MEEIRRETPTLATFVGDPSLAGVPRVEGTAIFLTASNDRVPFALLNNLRHNKVLHMRNVFLTVGTADTPHVPPVDRVRVEPVAPGFHRAFVTFGFMEEPDVPKALRDSRVEGEPLDSAQVTWFASRETVLASDHKGMPMWRDKLFAVMARNTVGATQFYRVPGNRLVELGTQVQI